MTKENLFNHESLANQENSFEFVETVRRIVDALNRDLAYTYYCQNEDDPYQMVQRGQPMDYQLRQSCIDYEVTYALTLVECPYKGSFVSHLQGLTDYVASHEAGQSCLGELAPGLNELNALYQTIDKRVKQVGEGRDMDWVYAARCVVNAQSSDDHDLNLELAAYWHSDYLIEDVESLVNSIHRNHQQLCDRVNKKEGLLRAMWSAKPDVATCMQENRAAIQKFLDTYKIPCYVSSMSEKLCRLADYVRENGNGVSDTIVAYTVQELSDFYSDMEQMPQPCAENYAELYRVKFLLTGNPAKDNQITLVM